MARGLRLNPWLALAAGLAIGAGLGAAGPSAWLDWQPVLAWRQPWRAWSAAFVHWSAQHLIANLAGCAVLALLGRNAGLGRRAAQAWLLAWPLTQFGLLAWPALAHYGGLSGVLHAGAAVAAVELLRQSGRAHWIGVALTLGLVLKLVLEQPFGPVLRQVPGWDIPLAPAAHLSGALAGTLCALLLWRRDLPRA